MSYPTHLRRQAEQIETLWGSNDPALLFPGDQAKALLPWPRARRHSDGHLLDREAVQTEFACDQPAIALIDPRNLWASQPYILQAGVRYYLTPTWFRTGRTWSDQNSPFNRLPVIERRADGTDVILGGHHRSSAALLRGEPVLAHVVHATGHDASTERVDLRLPCLAVGRGGEPGTLETDATNAVSRILTGEMVTVGSYDLADQIAERLTDLTEGA